MPNPFDLVPFQVAQSVEPARHEVCRKLREQQQIFQCTYAVFKAEAYTARYENEADVNGPLSRECRKLIYWIP